jgi:hypothetical protein
VGKGGYCGAEMISFNLEAKIECGALACLHERVNFASAHYRISAFCFPHWDSVKGSESVSRLAEEIPEEILEKDCVNRRGH